MDGTRESTLYYLAGVFKDPKKSKGARQNAYRNFCKIREQMKDKHLKDMRLRLVKAAQADDKYEMWKIECQIRDYLKEPIEREM